MADDMRRSYRSNVDEDIRRYKGLVKENEAEVRANERMRRLFGGSEARRGLGNLGRTDLDMSSGQDRLRGSQRELDKALEYRRMYPDEQPVGSPGRPDLIYKKGGAIKKMAKGGMTRGDGCATRGKTKGRMI